MSDERRQVFHDSSRQANESLKQQFINFGTKLDEFASNPEVLTEAYMLLRKTDKQGEQEQHLLVSVLDNDHLRDIVAGVLREAILCEVQQARVELAELKTVPDDRSPYYEACYAARMGRDTLGTAHRLIKDFMHRANLADNKPLVALCEHIEQTSRTLVNIVVKMCADKNKCEDGPAKCPLAEKLE